MPLSEKAILTIVARYGSYEEYVRIRYHSPEKADERIRIAKLAASKHKGKRGFNVPGVAKRAVNKRWGKSEG